MLKNRLQMTLRIQLKNRCMQSWYVTGECDWPVICCNPPLLEFAVTCICPNMHPFFFSFSIQKPIVSVCRYIPNNPCIVCLVSIIPSVEICELICLFTAANNSYLIHATQKGPFRADMENIRGTTFGINPFDIDSRGDLRRYLENLIKKSHFSALSCRLIIVHIMVVKYHL